MQKILNGIDLVDFGRIEQMLEKHGNRFLNRIFTDKELQYAESVKNNIEKLSGRFACKEAVLKMLGTGWRGKIAWTDIEITNNPMGRPEVNLKGEVQKIAEKMRIDQISISITHTSNFAIASAVALAVKDE
jgi:holo-[acyl-carrier protein] synthase